CRAFIRVGSGVWLARFSLAQKSSDELRIVAHITNRNDGRNLSFDDKENAEIAAANDSPPKEPMLLRKHLWIPFDPRNGLAKPLAKPNSSVMPPGVVVSVGVAKVLFDERQKLYRLALHRRAARRSNSCKEIRSTFPERYAFQRVSKSARSSALTGRRSSTAARQSSSANLSFCRFGNFRSSGNCARAMERKVRVEASRSTPAFLANV